MYISQQNNIYGNRANERALNAIVLENLKKKKEKEEEEDISLTEKAAAGNPDQNEDSIEISPEGRLAAGQVRDVEENSISDKQDDKTASVDPDESESSEKQSGKVAVNEGKRMRQIAAAQTRGQVQQVLALLQKDLSDCKSGLEKGWCDESEIAKVEALISKAKARMSQVPQESQENQGGLDEFAMASLM